MHLLKQVKRLLTGVGYARYTTVFPDDVFICSYPKSGNTWAKFLLANLLYPHEEISFANIEDKMPSIYYSEGKTLKVPRPRLLKSHEAFDPRYQRVIYLVRDPRDVVLSLYHYAIKLKRIHENYDLDQFTEEFIIGNTNRDYFGCWGENVGSWLGAREHDPQFLFIKYEDMLADSVQALTQMVQLIGFNKTPAEIQAAVEKSSFNRLQSLEAKESENPRIGGALKGRKDKYFIRKGQHQAWKEELSPQSIALIENKWRPLMQKLGYL